MRYLHGCFVQTLAQELLTRACQRQLNSVHAVVLYDESTSRLCPPLVNSFVDALVSCLADSCISTVLLDGNHVFAILSF